MEMLWPGQDTDRFHGGVACGLLEQLYASDPSYTVCQTLDPPLRDTPFFLNVPTFTRLLPVQSRVAMLLRRQS